MALCGSLTAASSAYVPPAGPQTERAKREPPDEDDDAVWRPADSYLDYLRGTFDELENARRGVEPAQPVADIVQCGLPPATTKAAALGKSVNDQPRQ